MGRYAHQRCERANARSPASRARWSVAAGRRAKQRDPNALRYDPENRLIQDGASWTAGYTGDGLRAWKNSNGAFTYFYYDGGLPILEADQNGSVKAVNTFGPNGPLSRHTSSGSTFYTFDPRGRVGQRLNSSGACWTATSSTATARS